ncbi:MAG: monofunctional biosynthetic peptidoglycan transglycosylase [Bacteroidetes bacterium]|nr:monofunctional biosynthetic peptidoglycan transglycosylase [Bacteroidota bacterium]
MFRFFVRTILGLLVVSMLYLVVCKWIFPLITITQIGALIGGYGLKRDYVSWSEISPNVKLAALASEDQLFPEHDGFDWQAIEKSLDNQQSSRRKKRPAGAAASTISQQTAKNVFLWQGSGWGRYVRKAPEAFYTKMIEWIWGKKRILEVYLNVIEMGPGIFGIEAASRQYFHKSASSLSRQEAAMIIACLPNPKKFTVVPQSKRVKWRTPAIIRQMGFIESDPDVQTLIH